MAGPAPETMIRPCLRQRYLLGSVGMTPQAMPMTANTISDMPPMCRQGLLTDQARLAKDLGDRLIDLKETMQILDAFIEGGHDKAAPVGLRVTEGREVRRKKLGQELGITSD